MDDMDQQQAADENARLRQQLLELQKQRQLDKEQYERKLQQEREGAGRHVEASRHQVDELQTLKQNMVKLTKQLDDEVTRRDQALADAAMLERRVAEISSGQPVTSPQGRSRTRTGDDDHRDKGAQVSTKLMRVVDQWMRQHDLQQALLRGAHINDQSFTTLGNALIDCPSLQTLDLSQNMLTMDSCSDLCQLITTAPNLSFMSLADNMLSLRSVGYFMTAVMERQNTKKLMPLDLLDLSGNEGLLAAAAAVPPPGLLASVKASLAGIPLPPQGVELVAQVTRALWRFLHETGHPQVKGSSPDEVAFGIMDKVTLRKLESALSKIMLLGVEPGKEGSQRPVTGNLAFYAQLESEQSQSPSQQPGGTAASTAAAKDGVERGLPGGAAGAGPYPGGGHGLPSEAGSPSKSPARQPQQPPLRDPFADLKSSFEPPKDKLKTFNLKQIVTRNGTVLMNMLERLLETTDVDAHDIETEQTLLEYACNTGNMGLAKLCYRRGAKLAGRTRRGDTPFNIVTRSRRYDLMEFLHTYGVKVNSCDKEGLTALHIAAKNDDVDGICRLVEWGADVNIKDLKNQSPIHLAAAAGNTAATMLLLEVGADMNAKDDRLYTAAAHANMNSHFELFDRLRDIGGRRHGQMKEVGSTSAQPKIGELVVASGVLKSSSLGRIGKISVEGLPGPIKPTLTAGGKK